MPESAKVESGSVMASQHEGRGTITILAAAAAGVVIVLLGVLKWDPGGFSPVILSRRAEPQAPAPQPEPPVQKQATAAAPPDQSSPPPTIPVAPPPEAPAEPKPAPPAAAPDKATESPVVPSFDLVRVEPN